MDVVKRIVLDPCDDALFGTWRGVGVPIHEGRERPASFRDILRPEMFYPGICCLEEHYERNQEFCLLENPSAISEPGPWQVNVRSIVLRIKALDDWRPLGSRHYPINYLRTSPSYDLKVLHRHAWEVSVDYGFDIVHPGLSPPNKLTWRRQEDVIGRNG